jgi:hypothetical protein
METQAIAAVSSDDIWVVGSATVQQRSVEHWNGSYWSIVPSPNPGYLYGVTAISSNDVWAVGYYITPNATQTTAMHWDGTVWSHVPTPNVGS